VFTQREGQFEWREATTGDVIHVPGGARHAFRNSGLEPVIELITTTPKLGRFFLEVGRPVTAGSPPPLPTREDFAHFLRVADSYGYWNASPGENAAIGITLPAPPD
jgi:hypothetical protein